MFVDRCCEKPLGVVISTKAEGRAEKSGCAWTSRNIHSQMSRRRWRSARQDKPCGVSASPANMTSTH